MREPTVLLLPGWYNSGPDHWQSHWEALYGDVRVEQHDWEHPLRGDWQARLEEVVLEQPEPVVLVAHSLGCQLVAAWAAHSRHVGRVRAALLVAPGDPEQENLSACLYSWTPVIGLRLPFPSVVMGSQDDPYCSAERARQFAAWWGSEYVDYGRRGHINAESGLGAWPQGRECLLRLV